MKKYLLFDRGAITRLISSAHFQSIDEQEGKRLVEHFCVQGQSEAIENIIIEYLSNGVIFTLKGQRNENDKETKNLFCVDLTTCHILMEKANPSDLLTVMQKSFRLAIKIWDRKPFSASERFYESKSILFPFALGDRRRLVVERSNPLPQFAKNCVDQPLLAYKYSPEDPPSSDEEVDTSVLEKAIQDYLGNINKIKQRTQSLNHIESGDLMGQLQHVSMSQHVESENFRWLGYEQQYERLTDTQKSIVDFQSYGVPLRIEGPAGTGKTIAMIMRAYRLLMEKREAGTDFHIIFFSHNESTHRRCRELFSAYQEAEYFLSGVHEQSIQFTTLLEYCRRFAEIHPSSLLNSTPENVKDEQLQWIGDVLETSQKRIKTFRPLLSENVRKLFDNTATPFNIACRILQHEFSIQIKGRTDATFSSYKKIAPIKNGLPFENEKDQELIFSLFTQYQSNLSSLGVFDADDVVMEALSRLNAPVWRRERQDKGFDMIFVDEMHLFNLNEQSVFHFLTKPSAVKAIEDKEGDIPICFALDYGQSIGDQGDIENDYIAKTFTNATQKNLDTVFRNSPFILRFCESIAASGTLMFQEDFRNSYSQQNPKATHREVQNGRQFPPELFMYESEEEMMHSLRYHLNKIMKELQCRPCEVAIIDFCGKTPSTEYMRHIVEHARREFVNILVEEQKDTTNHVVYASPYDVNGLEFQAVILLNVDAGYVPQKTGISDISRHFVTYSAYNLLYVAASRAKSRLILLGSKVHGQSICLEHAIKSGSLVVDGQVK